MAQPVANATNQSSRRCGTDGKYRPRALPEQCLASPLHFSTHLEESMFNKPTKTLLGMAALWTLCLAQPGAAQNWTPLNYIEPGTSIPVRTTQAIDSSVQDGLVYTGTVDEDVRDREGRVAIPKGATT